MKDSARMRPTRLASALPLAIALVLAGCGGSTSTAPDSASLTPSAGQTSTTTELSGPINVFAAASLKESFTTLGTTFEEAHPGTKITFNFGPSSGLAASIISGAPADIFASASTSTMDNVVAAQLANDPKTFASNIMQIAVPVANPGHVDSLDDLAKSGVKVALCQAQVPCGTVAAKVFSNAGLKVTPVTQEVDVKAVLTKVTLGEVDAGVVYVTDVRAAGDRVTGIDIPKDVNASTAYPIAALTRSANGTTAQAFSDYVRSDEGRQVLTAAGFASP